MISDFELQLNHIKNSNLEYNNNLNKSNLMNSKNNIILEELKKNYIQDFKKENAQYFNDMNLKMENKNEAIFKLLEQHDIAIKDLNTKIEKIKNNFEIDNKKNLII